jgi:hypothetical protein
MTLYFCKISEYPWPHTETECFYCKKRDSEWPMFCSYCCAVTDEYDCYDNDGDYEVIDEDYDIFQDGNVWPQS